ncbi:MAG: methylated-DNA--[protein]-cysteine S-methyltransferase, partial [Janthinobacterium lividum]
MVRDVHGGRRSAFLDQTGRTSVTGAIDSAHNPPQGLEQAALVETIGYCIADSPLGRMLVATTAKGVCSIAFADADGELLQELRERFADATLLEDPSATGMHVQAVLASLLQPAAAPHVPLDVRASPFQQRVWQALQAIPRGETRTYTQVAAGLGQPSAVRAVARACACNPVALVIPCHRVLGAGGTLTGYRWGLDRKRRLLALEQQQGSLI